MVFDYLKVINFGLFGVEDLDVRGLLSKALKGFLLLLLSLPTFPSLVEVLSLGGASLLMLKKWPSGDACGKTG